MSKSTPESFSNLIWYIRYTPEEMKFIAKRDRLFAVCYTSTNPITNTVWFHIKHKIYA